jgi:hypothetical protein
VCDILVYCKILHNSNNVEYDIGYEVESYGEGGSSILIWPRFLGRTENSSEVSLVSRKIITTMIPEIQNKASKKRVAVITTYTSQTLHDIRTKEKTIIHGESKAKCCTKLVSR